MGSATEWVNMSRNLPESDRASAIANVLSSLPASEARAAVSAAGLIAPPAAGPATNLLWTLFVGALCAVFIASSAALLYGLFSPVVSDGVKPETVFTIFSTVAAYLVGLFSPSPRTSH